MRLCLINPLTLDFIEEPSETRFQASRPDRLNPPIGILTLAALLEQQGIHPDVIDLNALYFDFFDQSGRSPQPAEFLDFVSRPLILSSCDVFGFGSICGSYHVTLQLARRVKEHRPESFVMIGGPQASVVSIETLEAFPFIDCVVRGEADETLLQLLDAIGGHSGLEAVPGITIRRGGGVVKTADAPLVADLDRLPMPAYQLYPHMTGIEVLSVELGRGCPFTCTFCSTNDFFRRRFRLRSPERVLQEMRVLRDRYGVNRFRLVHDLFTVDRKRVVAFCNTLLESGENFRWSCSARTDLVDDELMLLMAEAGCGGMFFGIESGSSRMQRLIDKDLDLDQALRAMRLANRLGMNTTVSLISGYPEESQEDLEQSVDFFMKSAVHPNVEAQLNVLIPLAATPILTSHLDKLVFDPQVSDWYHPGAPRDEESQRLVQAHPAIFPNFYYLRPRSLNRRTLRELRYFLREGMRQMLWLLAVLHRVSGTFLSVFDRWQSWRPSQRPETAVYESEPWTYYRTRCFRNDFMQFVTSELLDFFPAERNLLEAVLMYESTFNPWNQPMSDLSQPWKDRILHEGFVEDPQSIVGLAPDVAVQQLPLDVASLIAVLQSGAPLTDVSFRPAVFAGRVTRRAGHELFEIPELTAQILDLCDGVRTPSEIVSMFAVMHRRVRGVPAAQVCRQGLRLLAEQGLICDLRASVVVREAQDIAIDQEVGVRSR